MNYWQKRALEREEDLFLQSQEVIEKVKKSYYRINQNIKKEIEVLQNKLDNLENATVSDVEAYNFRKNLLKDLEKKIIEEYSSIAKEEIKETEKFYKSTIKNTYNQISEDLRSVNVGTSFSLLKTEDIEEILKTKWLGSNYSRRVWSNTTILANELSNIILDGITAGRTLKEMSEDLERIMKVGAYSAERLIRTEFNYFSNQSSIRAYKDYGIDKYQFLAAIDNRTSELCIEMHEKVFYVKDVQVGKNYPPLHPFCRSTTIAYFDELQNMENDGIIEEKSKEGIELHSVGKLQNKVYKDNFKDLVTDEVIITDKQIEHIEKRRKDFYKIYSKYFDEIINYPDIIFKDNKNKNTLLVCKEIVENDIKICIVLRLILSDDNPDFKNSIITSHPIGERNFNKYLRTKKIIYKKE